jgi:hypothetical protein
MAGRGHPGHGFHNGFTPGGEPIRMADTITLSIEGPDGSDELAVPGGLIDLLAEGDEGAPAVVGDVALCGLAQRIHAAVHHGENEPSEELQDVEQRTLDLFEERFGMTYGEATGHQH